MQFTTKTLLAIMAIGTTAGCTGSNPCDNNFAPVAYRDMTICVSCDYYSNEGIRLPLDLDEAYKEADRRNMILPTPDMVDAIYENADLKLDPRPLPPSPSMTTMPDFRKHDRIVDAQIRKRLDGRSSDNLLIAGQKKDLVAVSRNSPTVAIYGWHRRNGVPIQPYNARDHDRNYKDYSHGVRFVSPIAYKNGVKINLDRH